MKKEPIYDYLRRRLADLKGLHNRIAIETSVSQSTVSRIHLGQCSPSLDVVQPLLDWFERYDKSTAVAGRAKRVRVRRSSSGAAAPALSE